jgi:hypothetical protein
VTPQGQLRLTVLITESKYVDSAAVAAKRKESQIDLDGAGAQPRLAQPARQVVRQAQQPAAQLLAVADVPGERRLRA